MTSVFNREESTLTGVRDADQVKLVLSELPKQIDKVIDLVTNGVPYQPFSPEQITQALTDRELLTLELWAGDDEVIRKECDDRRKRYEELARRFAPRGKTEPAA